MTALKIILAFLAGLVAGSLVNMALVSLGPHLIPPPPGVEPGNMESLRASIHLFAPRHFVFPFLAHALGTFTGALVAYLLAPQAKRNVALGIGVFFLIGGIAASFMIPAPAAFLAIDLALAYLPMAWLAARLGAALRGPGRAGATA